MIYIYIFSEHLSSVRTRGVFVLKWFYSQGSFINSSAIFAIFLLIKVFSLIFVKGRFKPYFTSQKPSNNRIPMKIPKLSLLIFFFLCCLSTYTQAQVITSPEIDNLVERTLKTFDVPGIAVAVVKDGKVIHAKGYGVRSLNTKQKVDENTLFGIASNSKAFTAAALGMLIDEKKLKWDDKVRDFIPEFKMYDPFVTE